MSWRNWAGNQECRPAVTASPATRSDVALEVTRAAAAGQVVRVAGASHSFTDAVATDGALLSLHKCNRVLEIDPATHRIRVEAGITLRELNRVMAENGLAFPNLGDIEAQSIAGATATGTHGTGVRLQNLSAALVSIELVTADGSTIEVNADQDADIWRAARVSIGALGVVTAVTVQAVPAFTLEAVDRPMAIEDILGDLDELLTANDHFQLFTFAHSPLAMTSARNRVDRPAQPMSRARAWVEDELVQNHLLRAVSELGRRAPRTNAPLQRIGSRMAGYSHRVDRSDRIFTTTFRVPFVEMEYAIPREHTAAAVREIRELARRPEFNVTFPIEVRWVAPDDAYLSPAGGRDTCYIAIHQYHKEPYEPYFRAAEAIFDSFAGRPHWGKMHFQTPETLRPRYPAWDDFAAVRNRLDPERRFANAYIDRVLGK
ncbi:D-arabinono-1,4-lactone oxidase [Nocardia stercoris]|uniref:FAD-binding protein n=1 Tax=Nocardia stercoris TaxID=2483361 RepID=A0A3M2KZ99_9NOCA|nr:D-arabinono-1,4-lactone oxidase [Nocardia stercoris]RMI27638.1 FAD-binding protein [Nocardia stercoris]